MEKPTGRDNFMFGSLDHADTLILSWTRTTGPPLNGAGHSSIGPNSPNWCCSGGNMSSQHRNTHSIRLGAAIRWLAADAYISA
ncbi:MAG: hypothetical protein ABI818_00405 [Acidobacteriota bacterium]